VTLNALFVPDWERAILFRLSRLSVLNST